RRESGFRQIQVDGETAVIDALVQMPQRQLVAAIVPVRQSAVDLAHGDDILPAVLQELSPLLRVRLARGAAQLHVPRTRLAKKLNQFAATFVLGLVVLDAERGA